MNNKTKLLVIGIDGADLKLINDFITQGLLPNFSKIIKKGFAKPLCSTMPPTTFPAWTSFMTGKDPSYHGVSDFTVKDGYKIKFTGANNRNGVTWMEHLEANGLNVGMAWFPASYPPLKLNGYHISGWDSPVTSVGDSSFVYPDNLHKKLQKEFSSNYLKFDEIDEFSDDKEWYFKAEKKLIEQISQKSKMAQWLLKNYNVDAAAFYFGETDTASHHFWSFFDENSPRRPQKAHPELKNVIPNIYAAIDNAIGEIADSCHEEIQILLVSDHGSMGNSDYQIYLNRFLKKNDFLSFKDETISNKAFTSRNTIVKYVPKKIRRHLFKIADGLLPSIWESNYRFKNIDWANTLAFSEETPYGPSVWINQLGREPGGKVKQRDKKKLINKIIESFADFKYENGQKVVKNIYPRETLYNGPLLHLFPDLIIEFNEIDGYLPVCQNSKGKSGETIERLQLKNLLGRKGTSMPGGHAQFGIIVLNSKQFERNLNQPKLHNVFNVICSIMEVWPPETNENINKFSSKIFSSNYSYKEENIVSARLKKMGYIDS